MKCMVHCCGQQCKGHCAGTRPGEEARSVLCWATSLGNCMRGARSSYPRGHKQTLTAEAHLFQSSFSPFIQTRLLTPSIEVHDSIPSGVWALQAPLLRWTAQRMVASSEIACDVLLTERWFIAMKRRSEGIPERCWAERCWSH